MRKAVLVAGAALLAACSNSPGEPLNTALAGTWSGPVTLTYNSGGDSASYTGHIVVAVSGNSASVADVCPYGSGTLTATGSGNSATWSGNLVCPTLAFPGGGCPSLVFTYQNATGTLNGTTLTVVFTGTSAGCGNGALSLTFVGTQA